MNESLYHNKISYLNEKEKKPNYLIWISLVLALMIWITCFVPIRLSYKMTGIYNEETGNLEIYWPYEQIEKLHQIEKIKIEEEKIDFKIVNMSEIKVNENTMTNFQIIEIQVEKKYRKKQILSLQVFDKKEKIIFKLEKIMLGG